MRDVVSKRTRYPGPITEAKKHPHDAGGAAASPPTRRSLRCWTAIRPSLFDINLYDYDAEGQVSPCAPARAASCRATSCWPRSRPGGLWVNLRDAQKGCPELWAAAIGEFRKMQATWSGAAGGRSNAGQLILSSPVAKVPYHFDPAGVVLFHLRGRKRVYVYPGDEGHLPETNMEQVVARQTTEELPYTLRLRGRTPR
jgi:hypothetical protein